MVDALDAVAQYATREWKRDFRSIKEKKKKEQDISNYLESSRTGEGERKGVMKVERLDRKKLFNKKEMEQVE